MVKAVKGLWLKITRCQSPHGFDYIAHFSVLACRKVTFIHSSSIARIGYIPEGNYTPSTQPLLILFGSSSISNSVGDHVLFPMAHLGVTAIAMKTAAKPQSESHLTGQ